ncbi:MAG TPA: nuclear transport factor 2 family protein [Planctomycetota bacterium]|nr:nuclear transport factor 2 family protein [Planctomycetota bacterium]
MKFFHALSFALFLATSACVSASKPATKALLESDRAFNASTQTGGIVAWVNAFDTHGSQVDDEFRPITGATAIRAHMQELFADPLNKLTWEPDQVTVSEHGNLGMTSGRFEMRRLRADGSVESVQRGRYFDVWRRTKEGAWKLLYDVGEFDQPEKR